MELVILCWLLVKNLVCTIHESITKNILTVREQLDETLVGNSAIHIQNRGAGILHSSGAVSFEVKKGLKESLRAIFSELKTQKNDS